MSLGLPEADKSAVGTMNRPLRFGVSKGDGAFDLFDQVGHMDATWAGVGTVEDGSAAPHTI